MSPTRERAALDRAEPDLDEPAPPRDAKGGSRVMRGLAIGSLVALAIAGSTILQRRRVRDRIRRELLDEAD